MDQSLNMLRLIVYIITRYYKLLGIGGRLKCDESCQAIGVVKIVKSSAVLQEEKRKQVVMK